MVIASEHDVLNSLKSPGLKREELTKVFHDPALNNDLYIAFSRITASDIVKITSWNPYPEFRLI